jgi:hypothetical protein
VVRHVVRWAIYACSLVQAKRVCLKFEAPIVLSIFQIYDAIWLRGVPIPEGSIDPQCVEKHRWIDGVERTYRRLKPSNAATSCWNNLNAQPLFVSRWLS